MRPAGALRLLAALLCSAACFVTTVEAQTLSLNGCGTPVASSLDTRDYSIPSANNGIMFNVTISATGVRTLSSLGASAKLYLTSLSVAPGPNCTGAALYTSSVGVTARTIADSSLWTLFDVWTFNQVVQPIGSTPYKLQALDLARSGGVVITPAVSTTVGLFLRCSATSSAAFLPSIYTGYAAQPTASAYFSLSPGFATTSFPLTAAAASPVMYRLRSLLAALPAPASVPPPPL